MKLTNQRLLGITEFLNVLTVDGKDKDGAPIPRKQPVKLAFAIRKNRKAITGHLEDFEAERRELLKRYCEVDDAGELVADDKGQATFSSDEDRAAFAEAHLELLTTPVEVTIHKVTEATVEQMDRVEEYVLAGLEFMVEGWETPVLSKNGVSEEA